MFRSKAEQKVADAGYDPARLPPGQYLTQKWPVLHAGGVPETDLATWDFRVFGEVENPITQTWERGQPRATARSARLIFDSYSSLDLDDAAKSPGFSHL